MSVPPYQSLNTREQEILQLVADGLSNRQIGERLSISVATVKWYLQRIYTTLDVKRRTQAVAVAQSHGLLDAREPQASPTIPNPPTPFIGRQKELAQILEFLDSLESRLLSIVGPGGIGKTRLALEVAAQFQRNTQRPVYFVTLESVQEAAEVVPMIAGALGLQFGRQQSPCRQLVSAIGNRKMLLVLDNCEHVLEAMSLIPEILAVADNLQILTTSRERLNFHSETVFHLDGLAYPTQMKTLMDFDSIHLFLQTARRLRLDFEPSEGDIRHISHICELVEGMPLAIELAAGWTDMLSVEDITTKLQEDVNFLKTTTRDVPDRHHNMEAVFQYSWDLMTPTEQTVFKKLSVFRGGFDSDAAEAVAGASLDVLKNLLAKSRISEVQPGRWKLHKLLQQFAALKLGEDNAEYLDIVYAHCQHYGHLMRQYEHLFETDLSSFSGHMQAIYQDFENVLAGWYAAIEQPFVDKIGNYVIMLSLILEGRGLFSMARESLSIARQVYEQHADEVAVMDRLHVYTYEGWFAFALSDLDNASDLLNRAHEISTHPDGSKSLHIGVLMCFLGWTAYLDGQPELARAYLKQGTEHARKTPFAFGQWGAATLAAMAAFFEGNYETAKQLSQQALSVARDYDFLYGILWATAILGNTSYLSGYDDEAQEYWQQTLTLAHEMLLIDPVLLTIIGMAIALEATGCEELGLQFLTLVIHHPQCQATSYYQALHVLERFRNRFSREHIEAVMEQAENGQLSTPYLDSNFVIDNVLVDELLMLLDGITLL